MVKKLLLIICLLSLTISAQQFVNPSITNLEHTSYLGSESVNPFIINLIQIPINTNIEASLSLSAKSNSGNTMIHKTTLNKNNGTNIEIEFDAISEKNAIYFSYPFHKKIEVFMEVSLNSGSGKGKYNPMNWIVQDVFIERIHEVAGKSDLFKRKEKGFDNFKYKIEDTKGTTSPTESSIYSIPLILGANYYTTLYENNKQIISANATLSFKIPLKSSSIPQTTETGFGMSIIRTKKWKHNKSFTGAIHGSVYYHELTKNSDNNLADLKMTYKLSGLLGLNFHSRKSSNTYSIFTTLTKTSSRLDASKYSTRGNYLNQQAFQAAIGGNEYLELGSNYTIQFKNYNSFKIELTFREDLNLNINEINHTLIGRNSEDFGVFIGFRYLFF